MFKFTHLFTLSCIALSCLSVLEARAIYPLTTRGEKTECRNYDTDFTQGNDGWEEIVKLKFNTEEGQGPTFNASTYMHYGTFEATLKSAEVGGAVTAIILIADNKDEIDYELLGKGNRQDEEVQTNYFWGQEIVYGKNGASHSVGNGPISEEFHTYKIEWTPETIIWSVDGKELRKKTREETNDKFPSSPARVQIGLWDGSSAAGTAEWAHGPIEWNNIDKPVCATIKRLKVKCNPEYNNVID
ncbi:concanavalin A-like lectin/glucanase domain-containing protein [Sporodiniella umbellata]|nr:concanavalin A-like lectin/glucanase domain-containing protein [Sporodiniella umbellata]